MAEAYKYEVGKEEHIKMLKERIDGCTRGIFGLSLDASAAQTAGNTKNAASIEKALADTMKQKAAYDQQLADILK